MSFKLLTYVRHKEQGIEGLVINPSNQKSSHVINTQLDWKIAEAIA